MYKVLTNWKTRRKKKEKGDYTTLPRMSETSLKLLKETIFLGLIHRHHNGTKSQTI